MAPHIFEEDYHQNIPKKDTINLLVNLGSWGTLEDILSFKDTWYLGLENDKMFVDFWCCSLIPRQDRPINYTFSWSLDHSASILSWREEHKYTLWGLSWILINLKQENGTKVAFAVIFGTKVSCVLKFLVLSFIRQGWVILLYLVTHLVEFVKSQEWGAQRGSHINWWEILVYLDMCSTQKIKCILWLALAFYYTNS